MIGLLTILLLTDFKYIFGSDLDWRTQHYAIPEYFRTLFYSDKNIFPSFAFNLGAGQNIYNFSYYGLLSPIILISYLLPFIKMVYYIQVISIILYLATVFLFYKWIRKRFDEKESFFLALLFMFATPLLFHSHRHIMFVSYMPFLMMSLFGVDRIYNKKSPLLLIISAFLIIMTNYFFAVSCIFAIGLYAIYVQLEQNKKSYELIQGTLKVVVPVIISLLMSSIIIIPTAYTLFSGRAETNVAIDLGRLLIPIIHSMYVMYTPYSLGLSSIIFLAIIASFFKKDLKNNLLAVVFMLFISFPIFIYILNGGMYLNAKVLIPFIPLAILLIGNSIDNLFVNKNQTRKITAIYILVMLIGVLAIIPAYAKYAYFEISFVILLLIFLNLFQIKNIFKFGMVMVSFVIFLCVNSGDVLVTINDQKKLNSLDREIISYKIDDPNIYRFGDSISVLDNLNRINKIEQYKITMYSSVSNGNFNNFFFNTFANEVSYRNSAITAQGRNIMFNTYMGIKYMVADEDIPYYKKIDNKLYENPNVLPIGYSSNNLMSKEFFETLEFPYTNEALLNYVIVDKKNNDNYKTNIEKINPKYDIKNEKNLTIKNIEGKYIIKAKDNSSFVIELAEPIKNKVLFIKFKMDYNEKCSVGDNLVSINGIVNKLTCSSWKYHNKNYNFEYVISETSDITELIIEFDKGNYEISNLEMFTIDENYILDARKNKSEFFFDKNKTRGDIISGSINSVEDGYFVLTVPYDKGFEIFVNKEKVEYEKINDAFIGFKLSKGEHKIEIKYTAPYLKIGKTLSLVGIVIATAYIKIKQRRKENEKDITSSALLQ